MSTQSNIEFEVTHQFGLGKQEVLVHVNKDQTHAEPVEGWV
jgi:hypothetical protein